MKYLLSLLFALLATAAWAAPPLDADFSKATAAEELFEKLPGVQVATVDGTRVLVAADATIRFRDATVKPATKYTLTLNASFQGDVESIEENPRFEVFNRLGKTSARLPSREIRFFDAAGKPAGKPLVFGMPFKNQHAYQDVFYTPRDAVSARIALSAGKDVRLIVANLKFEETDDEGALLAERTDEG